jgi:hypothetical protein
MPKIDISSFHEEIQSIELLYYAVINCSSSLHTVYLKLRRPHEKSQTLPPEKVEAIKLVTE